MLRPHRFASSSSASTPPPEQAPKTKAGQQLIVLPPPRARVAELPKAPMISPLDVMQLAELQNVVLTYHKEVTLDATQMEISLSRPLSAARVSKERYKQLYNQLAAAFNLTQLRDYYDNAPLTTPSGSRKKEPAFELKRYAPKAEVLNAIMKDRWEMEISEEIAEREDVIIDKEMQVTRREIFFLIGEDGRILRDWTQECSARITVNVAKSLLTLSASQVSIETIENKLSHLLSTIISEEFDLTGISRIVSFSEDSIPVIARMTNTYIERVDDTKLRISGLDSKRASMDDARRLLLVATNIPFRKKEALLYSPPPTGTSSSALYPASELMSLPWTYRNRQWGRFKVARPKEAVGGSQAPLKPFEMVLKTIKGDRGYLNLLPECLEHLSGTFSEDAHERGLQSEFEATLGHLLYEINTDDYNFRAERYETGLETFVEKSQRKQRLLCTMFPGIPAFTQDPIRRADFTIPAPALTGASTKEYFQLRFMPSPWARPTTFERYPTLRMTADIQENGELQLPALYALGLESSVDLMLPTGPCDIRFTRRDEVPLGVRELEEIEALGSGVEKSEWERFMAASALNIYQNPQLFCSPTLKVHIPQWMVGKPTPISPHIAEGQPVEYVFTGLEYRRMVSLKENGYVLTRTVVEGGISGGRRTEVKLVYAPIPAAASDPEKLERLPPNTPVTDTRFMAFCEVAISMLQNVEGHRIQAAREGLESSKNTKNYAAGHGHQRHLHNKEL